MQKVLFVQDKGEGQLEIEGLWCKKEGDYFVVDNIPFVARRISLGDTIKAEYDSDENAFYFDDFVSVSGNSTIRLYFKDEAPIASVRAELKEYGCESEAFLARKIVAVNVPKEVSYRPIKEYLDAGEQSNRWEYEGLA
jgi:hypothetical protein